MSWADFHSQSERFAIDAAEASRLRDYRRAQDLYKEAGRLEKTAFDSLGRDKNRTRGITAVSAVALWYKGGEFSEAERFAGACIADSSIPDFAIQELRNLLQAIWTEHAKQDAPVDFLPGQVLVSVKGGEVVTGGAPLDLVVDKVQTIQSIFYRLIEFLNDVPHRRVGRPTRDIQESCRPWLFQSIPGSYQFSVGIQRPLQQDFFKQEVEPERIAQHFLEIVGATATESPEDLEKLVPDQNYRATFLKLARNLAPTGKSFERIELRANGDARPVSLGVESRQAINHQISTRLPSRGSEQPVVTQLIGTLRAVHLDKNWLELTMDSRTVHVDGLEDAVDDVIGPMVNRRVVVNVKEKGTKKYLFVDIELTDL